MPINITKKTFLSFPRPIKRAVVIFFDASICALSVWIAFGLRLDEWGIYERDRGVALIVALTSYLPLFIAFGLYRAIFRYIGSAALSSLVWVFISYAGLYIVIFTVVGVNGVPRSIGVIQPLIFFIGIGFSRYFIRNWLGSITHHQGGFSKKKPVALIYGAGSAGRQLAAAIAISKEMKIRGFIDDDVNLQGNTINGIRVFGHSGIETLIQQFGITDVLLAIPSAKNTRRNEIIENLSGCGVCVRTLPGLADMASGRIRISDLHDLDMNDLLGRDIVPPKIDLLEKNIRNKVVLVTGAGGSIGAELCRQIIRFHPKQLVLIDSSEHSLYLIYEELKKVLAGLEEEVSCKFSDDVMHLSDSEWESKLVPCLASVRDVDLLREIFKTHQPATVFHAAAYKHVPLVEQNPAEGIRNNVFGTMTCAQVSLESSAANFILVSTDKAVRPTNIMGASKRVAELVLQAMARKVQLGGLSTNFSMVRFGNVLGSSGSVAPLFSAQIAAGGPITLTHAEVTRYFMTIPEAAQLVIQSSAMADGGDVFVLNMGDPVRIYDLAVKMIYLSGLLVKDDEHPHGDIEIKITGLRPGEKLYEELLIGNDPQPTAHPKIMKAHEEFLYWEKLQQELESLNQALESCDIQLIKGVLKRLVPGYKPNSDLML